jgi:hypothetical protein
MIGVLRGLRLTIATMIAVTLSGPGVNAQEKWPSRPVTLGGASRGRHCHRCRGSIAG